MFEGFLLFALLAALSWALGNVVDKKVLNDFDNPVVFTFFVGVFGVLFSMLIPILGYAEFSSPFVIAISILLGIIYILPVYLYLEGLSLEEVSRAVPIMNLSPVFVLILGIIFLSETFTVSNYLGIFLTVTGAIMVSSENFGKEFFHLEANKAFWFIFSGTFLFAVYAVGVRWLLNFSDFWNVFFWSRVGGMILVSGLLLHADVRNQIIGSLSSMREKKVGYMALSELFNNVGVLLQTVALGIGAAALVQTVTSIQPLFVLAITIILSEVWNHNLGDDLTRKALILKLISIILIIAGIYLIS